MKIKGFDAWQWSAHKCLQFTPIEDMDPIYEICYNPNRKEFSCFECKKIFNSTKYLQRRVDYSRPLCPGCSEGALLKLDKEIKRCREIAKDITFMYFHFEEFLPKLIPPASLSECCKMDDRDG